MINTNYMDVIPTVTPVPTVSVVTTVDQLFSDLTIVEVLLPTGAGSAVQVSFTWSLQASPV